MTGEGK